MANKQGSARLPQSHHINFYLDLINSVLMAEAVNDDAEQRSRKV